MNINERLRELSLPDPLVMNNGKRAATKEDILLRRKEIKELLEYEIYGKIPSPPDHLSAEVTGIDKTFAGGKAYLYTLRFRATFGEEVTYFQVKSVVPNRAGRLPAIVYLTDTEDIPNKFLPAEEITDRGYALFLLNVKEIAPYGIGTRFHDGLARHLSPGRRSAGSPGKLAMWAWGAMRVMDYLEKQPTVNKDNIAVSSHGVLGISALIAGGYDERFKYIIANCAGLLGTAISREKLGEPPESLIEGCPTLFSKRFLQNTKPFKKRSYDQNFLLFLALDRHLLVGSAELDTRGDARGEFLALASLYEAMSILDKDGKLPKLKAPRQNEPLTLGKVSYHLRPGCEYFSRDDWNIYLDYIDKNL